MCTFAQIMKCRNVDSNAHSSTVTFIANSDDHNCRSATQAMVSSCIASKSNSKRALHGNKHRNVAQSRWSVAQAITDGKLASVDKGINDSRSQALG
ncbi:hypothetical protein ACOSP7_012814 [Xanthoceras sorbifolium]